MRLLLRNLDFARACQSADLICPDGAPVLAYAKWRGLPLRTRVTGCDIFRHLAEHPGLCGKSLFIVVESLATQRAAQAWATRIGLTRFTALAAPPALAASQAAQAALAHTIAAARPDILVLTLGAPLSEVFAHHHRHILPGCWILCLGQAVRVHLGLTPRAPAAWQRLGLEWLWRVRQEPWRLGRRYARAAAWFPVAIVKESKQSFFEKKDQKTFVNLRSE